MKRILLIIACAAMASAQLPKPRCGLPGHTYLVPYPCQGQSEPAVCPSGYGNARALSDISAASTLTDFASLVCFNGSGVCSESFPELKTTANGGKIENTVTGTVPYSRTIPADLVFVDSDGSTILPFEIESYNATSGALVVWVKKTVSATPTTVYACYGNPDVSSDQSSTRSVWDASSIAVYHLSESVTTTVYNSTSTASVSMTGGSLSSVAGKIGNAMDFASGSSMVPSSSTPFQNLSQFTISSWIYIDAYTPNNLSRWFEKTVATTFSNAGTLLIGGAWQGGQLGSWSVASAGTGAWAHYAMTLDTTSTASNPTVYINGASVTVTETQAPTGSWNDSANTVRWANNSVNTRYLDGKIDEARWSSTIRSADWIAAEYANQSSPSTWYTLGDERTGNPGVSEPPTEATGTDGVWTWYNDPRAIRSGDYTYFGGVATDGTVRAWRLSHTNGALSSFDLDSVFEVDDHDNPAFLRLSSGKVVAFYAKHNGASYYRVTSAADSISSWDSRITFSGSAVSYANPFKMADGSIWMFYRGPYPSNGEPYFKKAASESDLLSNTWGTATQIIENGTERPYIKYRSDGNETVFMAFNDGHPDAVANNNVYFAKLNTTTGSFTKMDGTEIGTTASAWNVTSGEKIWDAATGGGKAWIWEIAIDENNYPVIVYAQFPGASGVTVPAHKYRYARWTGSAWEDHEIRDAGGALYYDAGDPNNPLASSPYYSCGVALDPADPSYVYLSYNTGHATDCTTLAEYHTSDNGANWTSRNIETTGNNARPYVIPGNSDETWLAWWAGRYDSYIDYSTDIKLKKVR